MRVGKAPGTGDGCRQCDPQCTQVPRIALQLRQFDQLVCVLDAAGTKLGSHVPATDSTGRGGSSVIANTGMALGQCVVQQLP